VLATVGQMLSSHAGTIGLIACIILTFAAPLADRYLICPKRLQYRKL
jgi:hypothetical protein